MLHGFMNKFNSQTPQCMVGIFFQFFFITSKKKSRINQSCFELWKQQQKGKRGASFPKLFMLHRNCTGNHAQCENFRFFNEFTSQLFFALFSRALSSKYFQIIHMFMEISTRAIIPSWSFYWWGSGFLLIFYWVQGGGHWGSLKYFLKYLKNLRDLLKEIFELRWARPDSEVETG